MTVSTLITKDVYDGDGVTTHFPYTFPILEAGDIQVSIIDPYGNQTILSANYQVDTVTKNVIYPMTGVPLPSDGSTIELLRLLPLTQGVTFSNYGPLPAKTIEQALDRLTMITQQLQQEIADVQANGGGGGGGGGSSLILQPSYSADVPITNNTLGVLITSPDGLSIYRIYVSNRTAIANDETVTTEPVGTYLGLYNINPGKGIVLTTPDGLNHYRMTISNSGELTSGLSGAYPYDISITAAGKGFVFTTPDGNHTVRLAIDNAGEITTEELS